MYPSQLLHENGFAPLIRDLRSPYLTHHKISLQTDECTFLAWAATQISRSSFPHFVLQQKGSVKKRFLADALKSSGQSRNVFTQLSIGRTDSFPKHCCA